MDFVIGKASEIRQTKGNEKGPTQLVEAQVLHVRAPRGRRQKDEGAGKDKERRDASSSRRDPPGSRVLVLLVSDAHRLPNDLGDGKYRVFLRFARS